METALYISESPVGSNFNTMEQMSNFSTMEQMSYHTESMTTSSSEYHTDAAGNLVTGTTVLSRGPVNATNDIQQLDANHNRTDFKKMDMDQRTSSLRRIQSESATAEYKTNTLPIYGREQATAQIVQRPRPVRKTESVTAEIRGRGMESVTAEVKRRENGHWSESKEHRVQFVDGKCTCCPYGYHVDLDFVNYCESLSDGSYLSKLKRIEREKRKLRKSMEVFLKQQEQSEEYHSNVESANFMRTIDYQNSATNRMLDEIDSSVGNTIQSIDVMYATKYDSEGTSSSTSPQNSMKFSTFPRSRGKNIQEEISQYNTELVTTGLNDSQNSISSISTLSSEKASPMFSSFGQSSNVTVHDETTFQRITQITSDQLAATMATHLPSDDGAASPQSNTTHLSKQSLHAIREAMAESLQRMKELEEQVKALPVLQVRISVLKEEKRLLELKLKAKDRKPATRTVGVSVDKIEEVPKQKTPPPPPPKKVRMVGVGDHSVLEPYLLQPNLPESYTIRDNEMFSKETYVLERERSQSSVYSPFTRTPPKPLTRTIGIGEANVFDDGLKIHEKELRTVIIGQSQNVGKRNVGVECRVHTRDVGVSFAFDEEKPTTRTVGVNVDTGMIDFRSEEVRTALHSVLHRNVRSIGITCDFRPQRVDTGVQYSNYSIRSIGVGDSSIDVEVKMPVPKRTVGCDAQPTVVNKGINTDYGWKLDASTSTVRLNTDNKSSMTERLRQNNVGTITDEKVMVVDTTQTDKKVFIFMDQIKNAGCNTIKVRTSNTGMNTDFERKAHTFNKSVNTEQVRKRDIGTSDDRVDSFVCSFDDDEEAMEETTEEIVYTTEERIVESGWTDKVKAQQLLRQYESYDDESQSSSSREVTDTDTNLLMIKSALDSSQSKQSSTDKLSQVSTDQKSWKDVGKMEEVVEKKITSQGDGGNYTVTTITTRKSLGDDHVGKGTDTGGQEISQVVLSGQETIKPDISFGRVDGEQKKMDVSGGSGGISDSGYSSSKSVIKISGSVRDGGVSRIEQLNLSGDDGDSSTGGYSSRQIITRTSSGGGRFSPGDYSVSDGGQSFSPGSYTSRQASTRTSSSGGGSLISSSDSGIADADGELSSGGYIIRSSSSSSSRTSPGMSDGGSDFSSGGYTISTSSSSGSRMSSGDMGISDGDQGMSSGGSYSSRRVITRMSSGGHEISPSGLVQIGGNSEGQEMSSGSSVRKTTTIIRSSDISGDGDLGKSLSTSERASKLKAELDDLGISVMSSSQKSSSASEGLSAGSSSDGGEEVVTETITTYDIGGKSYFEKYLDLTGDSNRTSSEGGLTIENRHTLSPRDTREQKSGILKSCIKKSKEESQVKKGITFAENVTGGYTSSSTEEDSTEEEGSESSSDDDSYEEGSYDGREGSIVYQCKDDEAIAQGLPGAKMFDQNIRETYELSQEMRTACEVLAKYLEDSTEVQTKELNKSLNVIQQDWFKISSHKLSETHQVEDFLSCFNEISPRLLEYVVNMQDSNGNTAVHYAVSHCNFEVVSLLLDTGTVDLNKQNKAGYTATMLATLAYTQTDRQREVVQRLFSMSDVDATASKKSDSSETTSVSSGDTESESSVGSSFMVTRSSGFTNVADERDPEQGLAYQRFTIRSSSLNPPGRAPTHSRTSYRSYYH